MSEEGSSSSLSSDWADGFSDDSDMGEMPFGAVLEDWSDEFEDYSEVRDAGTEAGGRLLQAPAAGRMVRDALRAVVWGSGITAPPSTHAPTVKVSCPLATH